MRSRGGNLRARAVHRSPLAAMLFACTACAQGIAADGDAGADATPIISLDACGGGAPEECNGVDDDCDGLADEDFDVGEPCDSDDSDLCDDDETACTATGEVVCADLGPELTDVCNGVDDDCDAASDDGSEDPLLGLGCDGLDGDACVEGVNECIAGGLRCSDQTPTTPDLCNDFDDDCDASSADGSEDPAIGVACDGDDGDLCAEGTTVCGPGGVVTCSDDTGTSVETCNGVDDDCDGGTDEGFPRDVDPVCNASALLGSVSGDIGPDTLSIDGYEEAWFRLAITENSFDSSSYLSATIDLQSPPGANFDLYVHCDACGGALAQQSTFGSGAVDTVEIRRNDGPANESFDVFIEVRFVSSSVCDLWTLSVKSDTAVANVTCP